MRLKTYYEEPVGWDPDSKSYYLDLAFAASEWMVGLSFVAYFATLIPDFKVTYLHLFFCLFVEKQISLWGI